jgi:prepilin-type N-terminal cleavage/methylation domain-containing protein
MSLAQIRVSSGFTLLEMTIVVALVGIFFGFAIPSTRDWIGNRQVSALAESVAAGVRQAQIEAIQRSAQVDFVLTTSAVDAAQTNPSTAALSFGGLLSTDPALSLLVRVVGVANAQGFVQMQASTEGWRDGRVQGIISGGTTQVAGLTFSPLGRVTGTLDDTGSRAALAGNGAIVFRVLNSELPSNVTRRRCIVVSPAGATRVCEPQRASGDPRACLPQVSTNDCPAG